MQRPMTFSNTLKGCLTGEISLAGTRWRKTLMSVPFAALAGGGIVLALEPDHTSDLPLLVAFGLWSTHILFALLLFVGCLAAMMRIGLPHPLPAAAATLTLPAVFAPVSLLLDVGFGKPDEELASATNLMTVYLSEVAAVVPVTFAAALVTLFALYKEAASRDMLGGPVETGAISQAPALSDLISAIPRSLGNDIIRMHAQDHYVEVVTAAGRSLITERFSDCVGKLEEFEGIQCHRSHWISRRHVQALRPSGSAYMCTLSNGDRVPVSRRRYSDLRQWLRSDAQGGRSGRPI